MKCQACEMELGSGKAGTGRLGNGRWKLTNGIIVMVSWVMRRKTIYGRVDLLSPNCAKLLFNTFGYTCFIGNRLIHEHTMRTSSFSLAHH